MFPKGSTRKPGTDKPAVPGPDKKGGEQAIESVKYGKREHGIDRNDVDTDALKILARLRSADFKAYVVGGGVRDLLLGKTPKDFDLVTDATPKQIKDLFRNSRVIGRRFKLVHVYFKDHKIIEVSTFRDSSEEGPATMTKDRSPAGHVLQRDNTYGTEATDAFRRDLTVNGLFYDPATETIVDYVGGMQDLREGVIRIIGDPAVRIEEDPVRMIRVVRHAARSGFKICKKCLKSIKEQKELITECSHVRVFEEIKKDLCYGYSYPTLKLLMQTGLLDYLLPELTKESGLLLSLKSDLPHCLRMADEQFHINGEISATVMLALIALFTDAEVPTIAAAYERVSSHDKIDELLNSCFSKLAVPRKELEKIARLFSTWHSVLSLPEDRRNPRRLAARSNIDDLIQFVYVTDFRQEHGDLLKVLRQAQKQRHSGPRGGAAPRAPTRRRSRRRNDGRGKTRR